MRGECDRCRRDAVELLWTPGQSLACRECLPAVLELEQPGHGLWPLLREAARRWWMQLRCAHLHRVVRYQNDAAELGVVESRCCLRCGKVLFRGHVR